MPALFMKFSGCKCGIWSSAFTGKSPYGVSCWKYNIIATNLDFTKLVLSHYRQSLMQ
jgi:hypothetical protein